MSRIIDRACPATRQRIDAAIAAFEREQTEAHWNDLRRLMVDAERETSDWLPSDAPRRPLSSHALPSRPAL